VTFFLKGLQRTIKWGKPVLSDKGRAVEKRRKEEEENQRGRRFLIAKAENFAG